MIARLKICSTLEYLGFCDITDVSHQAVCQMRVGSCIREPCRQLFGILAAKYSIRDEMACGGSSHVVALK